MARKLSTEGLDLLKELEGFRARVYLDSAGLPTLGYGHLVTEAERKARTFVGRTLTEAEAEDLLIADVKIAELAVERLVRVPLKQHEFDALVLFTFNVGVGAFAKSTLLRKLNAGEPSAVPGQLRLWNKVREPKTQRLVAYRGLTNRREREVALWLGA